MILTKGKNDVDPKVKAIGDRIKARRQYLGLSQEQVAQRLWQEGVEILRAAYARYEAGTSAISATTLESLAKILDVKVSYFYGVDEEDWLADEAAETKAAYQALAPEMKASIRQLILAAQKRREAEDTTHGRPTD